MTKAQEVYEKVEAMVASGEVKKADAFKTLAEQYGQPVDSLRGAYYQHKRVLDGGGNPTGNGGGGRRTRRRETTSETAVESALPRCGGRSTASTLRSRRQRPSQRGSGRVRGDEGQRR